ATGTSARSADVGRRIFPFLWAAAGTFDAGKTERDCDASGADQSRARAFVRGRGQPAVGDSQSSRERHCCQDGRAGAHTAMSSLLITGGRVIDPASGGDARADVLIRDGRIEAIGTGLDEEEIARFDATGAIVAPGFIDMHVHLREPGIEHAETIETGARAGAAGGFTSICCMPNTLPVNDSATVTSYIVDRARKYAVTNVYPIGALTKNSGGEQLSAIGSMKNAGIVAISDDGMPVMNARVMRRAMEFARSFNLPVINHCEDLHLSAGGDMHEGFESVRLGLRGIPSCSEDVMVARDIVLAEVTGARYHGAHISARRSVEMVAAAK